MKLVYTVFILFALTACYRVPEVPKHLLIRSGDNSVELQEVFKRYKKPKDSLRLKAAGFLLENMETHVSKQGNFLKPYLELYREIKKRDSLSVDELNAQIPVLWDSVLPKYPADILNDFKLVSDLKLFKAADLIENIDLAFYVWENKPWAAHVGFDAFCELILPYRAAQEPLTNWRKEIIESYKWVDDSVGEETDPLKVCQVVNEYIRKNHKFLTALDGHPYLDMVNSDNYKYGVCYQRYAYVVNVMRALGIASSIDFTPAYNRWNSQHDWTAVLNGSGKFIAYNGGDSTVFKDTNMIPHGYFGGTKAYRRTFAVQKESLAEQVSDLKNVPQFFQNNKFKDVTSEYQMPLTRLDFPVLYRLPPEIKYGYLASFSLYGSFVMVDWARIENNRLRFNHVSSNSVYVPVFYTKGKYYINGYPVIFNEDYTPRELKPAITTHKIKLYRKYPPDGLRIYGSNMIGAEFQVSDTPDFLKYKTIHTIKKMNEYLEEGKIKSGGKYRYIRYKGAPKKDVDLSDMEIYGKDSGGKEIELRGSIISSDMDMERESSCKAALDDDIISYFHAPPGSWVGYDLGKPFEITRVKYLGRNNINVIEPGNLYELFYFNQKGWNSLGQQEAEFNYLVYEDVPENALLFLRNLTQGKEERVFIYENGVQTFW